MPHIPHFPFLSLNLHVCVVPIHMCVIKFGYFLLLIYLMLIWLLDQLKKPKSKTSSPIVLWKNKCTRPYPQHCFPTRNNVCRGHRKELEGDRENVSPPNSFSIKIWVHWTVRLRRPELPEFRQREIFINTLRKRKPHSCTVSLGNPQGLFPSWSPKEKGLGSPLS